MKEQSFYFLLLSYVHLKLYIFLSKLFKSNYIFILAMNLHFKIRILLGYYRN